MKKIFFALAILLIAGIVSSCSKSDSEMDVPVSPDGKSGSTARLVIKSDYLYAVDNTSLKVINIADPTNPTYVRTVDIGFGIETIYTFKDYLFIGSSFGMYVYSLNDPSTPTRLSQFQHATACDPVIANDTLAFFTLRNNEVCSRWVDTREIDVVDIKSITNPYLRMVYQTDDYPYGLDMYNNYLFVCHGDAGLVVYDINKMLNGNNAKVSSITGTDFNAYDAIIYQNRLFVVGENGFYQYDFSNIQNISLISSILKTQ
jgi:hypothetical protein